MTTPTSGAPQLEPESFLWYGDEGRDIVVGCFAFGTGIGEPMLARVGRQLAEDVAAILRLHPAFVTVPQLLAVDRPDPLDSSKVRSAFAVFYSLPETRIVREAARELGARLALTGRLVGEGGNIHLGMNILDVERTLLLGCAQLGAAREDLVDAVIEGSVRLLSRFSARPRAELASEAAALLGTRSYHAYYNFALAMDLERTALASGERVDDARMVQRLGWALRHDGKFVRALERMVSIVYATQSEQALRETVTFLSQVELLLPGVGLLHGEALRRLGDVQGAREALEQVAERFPYCAQAYYLLGDLEASERPRVAANHYRQAAVLEPRNALYAEKVARFGDGGA